MEGRIIFCDRVFIPYFKAFPFEETEAWGAALRDSIPKRQAGMLKAVPDDKSFRKNRAKPLIEATEKMLPDDFVSQGGLTKEAIIRIMKKKFSGKNLAKTYRKNVRRALKTFDQGELNSAMVGYQRGQSFGEYRFREALGRALGCLTPYLTGVRDISKIYNQLMSSGLLISDLAYDPKYLKLENDKINALLNRYLRADIIPFTTGGASHCDFVLIPESVTPADSTRVKEIKYKIYEHFLGQEQAEKLRATWIVIDESTPPDPNDYIGHPEKGAYFDMNLDIQVSKR